MQHVCSALRGIGEVVFAIPAPDKQVISKTGRKAFAGN